jgi:hypothetical protein
MVIVFQANVSRYRIVEPCKPFIGLHCCAATTMPRGKRDETLTMAETPLSDRIPAFPARKVTINNDLETRPA